MSVVESFDGAPIHYQLQGNGSPGLIFVHGWSCNRSFWTEQVDHFSRSHSVAALDLAGQGESGIGEREWDMASFAKDVYAVYGALGIDEVFLVGHSSGACVILEAAPLLGKNVVGLVGVDAMFYRIYSHIPLEKADELIRPFEEDFVNHVSGYVEELLFPSVDQRLMNRIASVMSSADQSVAIPSLRSIFNWDFREPLMAAQVPLACICSEEEVSQVDMQPFEGLFEVRTISNVGHFIMMERPAEFNEMLADLIQETP